MSSKIVKSLYDKILPKRAEIEKWFNDCAIKAPPPFYCSIDLRDSGHKIVPVDSNLYPAGFNNICPEDLRVAPRVFQEQIQKLLEQRGRHLARRILILPESHTSNLFYIENLYYLRQIIENSGIETRIGWYGPLPEGQTGPFKLKSYTEKELEVFPLDIRGGVVSAGNFVPDMILLNNDFSSGYPEPLDAVTQPILPSHTLGWHSRKKSEHFKYYNELAKEFAEMIKIDPWTIQIDTEEVAPVNFGEDHGTEKVAQVVDRILKRTEQAYAEHHVDRKPFVFVKNNAGTYGMGIMVAHSSEELRNMNRRTKNKMSVGKNRIPIESVVVQEGIPTATVIDRLAAEPVIYLFGAELIGGFLRTNTEKGDEENLNSQGMVFKKLCMSDLKNPDNDLEDSQPDQESSNQPPTLELVYGSIAKLSALATGMELAAHARQNN